MKRALVIAAGMLALVVPTAQAHTTIVEPPDSHYPYQQWIDEAKVPTPDGTVTVLSDDGSEWCGLGCADVASRTIWVRSGLILTPRVVFTHELGHIFDGLEMTDSDRRRFIGISGRRAMAWWDGPRDRRAGEWFADAYARCALLPRIDPEWAYSVGSGLLAGWRLQKACWLIRYASAT